MKRILQLRRNKGAFAGLIIAVMLWACVAISSIAIDIYHIAAVKAQLQNATDAGALAGAQELWRNKDQASADAYLVTGLNSADGRSVKNGSPDTTVQVTVVPPTDTTYGTVEVDAAMTIKNMIAPIFGRGHDVITVSSVAGTVGSLKQLYADQPFPMAVSWDAQPDGGVPLLTAKPGERFTFYLNSQQVKNAGFTSFTRHPASASYIQNSVEQALGLAKEVPGYRPALSIGDDIYLNNGIAEQKRLGRGDEYAAITDPSRPPLVFPVISGEPAFNQSSKVIGFLTFRVTDVKTGQGGGVVESITGVIERAQVRGQSGPPGTGGALISSNLQPGPVQLIR
jgi:hypothetical protein